jgi:hypothetical protein
MVDWLQENQRIHLIRNGATLAYPFVASARSPLPLRRAHHQRPRSMDETLNSPATATRNSHPETEWDETRAPRGKRFRTTPRASTSARRLVRLHQGDEVLHEGSTPAMRAAMERERNNETRRCRACSWTTHTRQLRDGGLPLGCGYPWCAPHPTRPRHPLARRCPKLPSDGESSV